LTVPVGSVSGQGVAGAGQEYYAVRPVIHDAVLHGNLRPADEDDAGPCARAWAGDAVPCAVQGNATCSDYYAGARGAVQVGGERSVRCDGASAGWLGSVGGFRYHEKCESGQKQNNDRA